MRTRTALELLGILVGVGWAVIYVENYRSPAASVLLYFAYPIGIIGGAFVGYLIGTIAEMLSPKYRLRLPRRASDGE